MINKVHSVMVDHVRSKYNTLALFFTRKIPQQYYSHLEFFIFFPASVNIRVRIFLLFLQSKVKLSHNGLHNVKSILHKIVITWRMTCCIFPVQLAVCPTHTRVSLCLLVSAIRLNCLNELGKNNYSQWHRKMFYFYVNVILCGSFIHSWIVRSNGV